jgi:hypothetical protein
MCSAVGTAGVSIDGMSSSQREARCSSSSCSLDSSVRREVRLHRRVGHRIDVPPSSDYVYHSRDWKILSDPLD